jgi:hypothetical protein
MRKILDGEDTDPPEDISPGKVSAKICTRDLVGCGKIFLRLQKNSVWPAAIHDRWRSTSWFTVYRNKHVMYCSFILLTVSTFWY